jgi:glycosyltransferase involved in cell wall biosynthesis
MVRLAAELCGTGCSVRIIGHGSSLPEGQRLARSLGLDADQIFLGSKSKEEAADYVAAADFALSTVIPNWALEAASINKVFDALAAGRPIVFNHGGWLADIVCASGAGWMFRDVSIADTARQVASLSIAPGKVLAAQEAATLLAHSQFSRDELFNQFSEALLGKEAILDAGKAPQADARENGDSDIGSNDRDA